MVSLNIYRVLLHLWYHFVTVMTFMSIPFLVLYRDVTYPGLHNKLFSVFFHTEEQIQYLIYVINLEDLYVERSES